MSFQEVDSICFATSFDPIRDTIVAEKSQQEGENNHDTPSEPQEITHLQSPLGAFIKGLQRTCSLSQKSLESRSLLSTEEATTPPSFLDDQPSSTQGAQPTPPQNPMEGFIKDLQRSVDYSLLKEAFDESADKIEQFVQQYLPEMATALISTNTTQKKTLENDHFSCVIKVRLYEGKIQVLAKSPCGEGSFKTVQKVVHLAGPMLENQPGPIYAYAKSKERKRLSQQLREIEAELQTATCPSCMAALESSASELRFRIERAERNFLREVGIARLLPHEADFVKMWTISKQKDPSQVKGILMEYCECDLYDLITSLTYPLSNASFDELCHVSQRILRSTAMMHNMTDALCHLDLKIGNILLKNDNGQILPKITDFGLAKRSGSPFNGPRGTLPYMAPEQFDSTVKEIGPSLDNWSLGIILLEIFYGLQANSFRSNSTVDYAGSHFHDNSKYPELFEAWKEIGQSLTTTLTRYHGLDDIIKGLLIINPQDRWTSQQAADAFEQIDFLRNSERIA